jgi:hypothetical protein
MPADDVALLAGDWTAAGSCSGGRGSGRWLIAVRMARFPLGPRLPGVPAQCPVGRLVKKTGLTGQLDTGA